MYKQNPKFRLTIDDKFFLLSVRVVIKPDKMLDSVYLHQLVIDQSSFYPVAGKMDQSQLNTTQDLHHLDRARSQPNKNLRLLCG